MRINLPIKKLFALVLGASFSFVATAQDLDPVSLEQLINTDIPTNQTNVEVAVGDDGEHLFIWDTGNDVIGRRYNSSFAPISDEFLIATASPIMDLGIEYWKDGKYIVSYLETGSEILSFVVVEADNSIGGRNYS